MDIIHTDLEQGAVGIEKPLALGYCALHVLTGSGKVHLILLLISYTVVFREHCVIKFVLSAFDCKFLHMCLSSFLKCNKGKIFQRSLVIYVFVTKYYFQSSSLNCFNLITQFLS